MCPSPGPRSGARGGSAASPSPSVSTATPSRSSRPNARPSRTGPEACPSPPPPAAHLVQTALEFIAQNAVKGITSDDVAKRVGCSRRLLELRFAEFHSESVHAALVRTRLAAVRRELTLTDRKLIHIARECGFKNAAVLKNLFRKTYGMSMRDYRKSHRAAAEQ